MLIQINSSEGSRGWEENNSTLIEVDGTLPEYIYSELMNDFDMTREEVIQTLEDNEFDGSWDIDEDEASFEGDESTVTYVVFTPTQEYVDMLLRNM